MSSSDASIVLVHGAWADGSAGGRSSSRGGRWRRTTSALPLMSFGDEVAALERITSPRADLAHLHHRQSRGLCGRTTLLPNLAAPLAPDVSHPSEMRVQIGRTSSPFVRAKGSDVHFRVLTPILA